MWWQRTGTNPVVCFAIIIITGGKMKIDANRRIIIVIVILRIIRRVSGRSIINRIVGATRQHT